MEESKLRSNTGEAWSRCAQVLKEHDDGQVRAWKEEIDTLLVFAGLFSGVLTAFNVQFYALLQPDATTAQTAMLLHISMQLENSNLNSGEVAKASRSQATSQLEMLALSATGTSVPMSAVRINVLVFASLVCSLAAASMAILVKQWLAQYTYGLSGTSRDSARLRQYRDDGLLRWKVAKIIMLLPMLLQVAPRLDHLGGHARAVLRHHVDTPHNLARLPIPERASLWGVCDDQHREGLPADRLRLPPRQARPMASRLVHARVLARTYVPVPVQIHPRPYVLPLGGPRARAHPELHH